MGAYILRFVLIDSDPEISRTVAVPDFTSLYDIHSVIQSVMSWEGYHLYEFNVDGEHIHEHHRFFHDNDQCREPTSVALSDLEGKTIIYTYDFGDYWQVLVEFEEHVEEFPGMHPKLLDWNENAPPEDCGGIHSYYEALIAAQDPKNPNCYRARDIIEASEFDEYRVLNSLESWGMQGVIDEGRTPLDDLTRMAMIHPVPYGLSGIFVFDTESEAVCKVSSSKKKQRSTEEVADSIFLDMISKSDVEADPERYIQIWDSPDEYLSRLFNDFLKRQNLAKLCKKPGESIQSHYQRVLKGLSDNVYNQWQSEMMAAASEEVYSWAKKNGYYFFNPIDSPVAANEALFYKLHNSDVDISDEGALNKFMSDYNKELQNNSKSKMS